jgi:hypothetical protein
MPRKPACRAIVPWRRTKLPATVVLQTVRRVRCCQLIAFGQRRAMTVDVGHPARSSQRTGLRAGTSAKVACGRGRGRRVDLLLLRKPLVSRSLPRATLAHANMRSSFGEIFEKTHDNLSASPGSLRPAFNRPGVRSGFVQPGCAMAALKLKRARGRLALCSRLSCWRSASSLSPSICKEVELNVAPEHGASLQLPLHCLRQGQIAGQKCRGPSNVAH